MRQKYRDRYRIASIRLPEFDYSSSGLYFITFCVNRRECALGQIWEKDGVYSVQHSLAGEIVCEQIKETVLVRPGVVIDALVVMPNHVHVIIDLTAENHSEANQIPETPHRGVSTRARLLPNSIGSIIGQIKSITTKRIRALYNPSFSWQPRFYDHVIRDEGALCRLREYIEDNPKNWLADKENPEGLYI